jgi:hypothetical protein
MRYGAQLLIYILIYGSQISNLKCNLFLDWLKQSIIQTYHLLDSITAMLLTFLKILPSVH